eukprot:CAMPEP_0117647754 /NCGR_PEP_ID=MMETSP0804-20121206/13_1 /TAXON_ID=1074897 /ORGANISM="Tetraselmis astigmatica, Strain CCMP880" /LENGTH=170 /DNA_ID=CAMNT_0005453257 /DNA_START=696 /DNA_END=1209 /DNA_ORIENTATION=+
MLPPGGGAQLMEAGSAGEGASHRRSPAVAALPWDLLSDLCPDLPLVFGWSGGADHVSGTALAQGRALIRMQRLHASAWNYPGNWSAVAWNWFPLGEGGWHSRPHARGHRVSRPEVHQPGLPQTPSSREAVPEEEVQHELGTQWIPGCGQQRHCSRGVQSEGIHVLGPHCS